MDKKILLISLLFSSLALSACTTKTTQTSGDQKIADKVVESMTEEVWPVFNSTEGKFKANFPKYPESTSNALDVQGVKMQYTQYSSQDKDGNVYMIQYNLYTNITASQLDPTKALEGAVNGSVASTEGNELVSSSFTTFKDHKAVDFVIYNSKQQLYLVGRNILVDNSLYSILMSSKEKTPATYQKFIDSFDFLE